jgi:superfamily I DNA/RNA helicase
MTVHQAKGREFDAAVVMFVAREAFPDKLTVAASCTLRSRERTGD